MTTWDTTEAIKAQIAFCERNEIPMYAPSNGICPACGRDIYDPHTYRGREEHTYGISVEEAASRLITGCPHCNATFCD